MSALPCVLRDIEAVFTVIVISPSFERHSFQTSHADHPQLPVTSATFRPLHPTIPIGGLVDQARLRPRRSGGQLDSICVLTSTSSTRPSRSPLLDQFDD